MLIFPNAKINIGLNIIRRRSDGYHDIETIFCPIGLCDVLEFVPSPGNPGGHISFTSTGLTIDCSHEQNLCVKAYRLLDNDFNLPAIDVHLHKVVPSGAGLGGGSSDAAFMLRKLAQQFIPELDEEELCRYASQLGSDCAFFIKNRPLFAHGRGNLFRETGGIPDNIEIVVVYPGVHVSTADAYAEIIPARPSESLEKLILLPLEEWRDRIKNDFEKKVIQKHPVIGNLKSKLYELGASYASMTGSGSSVYAIFRDRAPEPEDHFPGMFWWKGIIQTQS